MEDKAIIDYILACRDEAEEAKRDRMSRNKDNYDMFHLKHDFSHKEAGQSTEILSKVAMSVEQIRSFFQQALVDLGEWWKADVCYPEMEATMAIRPHEITKLTNYMLERGNYYSHVGNSVQTALLASLAISKVYGCLKPKPRYVSRKKGRGKSLKRWIEKVEDKTWELKFDLVRAENYYPDPTGRKLYEIEDMWVDYFDVLKMSEGDDAIYDSAAVAAIPRGGVSKADEEYARAREVGQNTTTSGHRPKVKLTEFWGNILDREGNLVYENVVATIANDSFLIRKPESNPLWHQGSPYTASPLMEVANSVWHKAPMDAPASHNRALIELYNLFVDAAMMQVHAVKQLRVDALANPAQVANGVQPGQTLAVTSTLPPGAKVLEPVTTTIVPNEAFNIFNIMNQEYNASAISNDLRNGVMPFRAVKATEVVEASQTITSIFQGLAKNYESKHSQRELELAWMTTAQNWDKISKEEFVSLFGKQRGEALSQLSPQDVFASTVSGIKFRVFGISLTLNKGQDFKKWTTLLQTIGAAPPFMEAFSQKYDFTKLLEEIMTTLDIDKYKIEHPKEVQMTMAPEGQPGPGEEGVPNQMSNVPEAGNITDMLGGPQFAQTQFPGSPATVGQGG